MLIVALTLTLAGQALAAPNLSTDSQALAPGRVSAVRSSDIPLPGLSVSGINIVANGQPVRLRGINLGAQPGLVSLFDCRLPEDLPGLARERGAHQHLSNAVAEWNKDTGGLIGVKPFLVSEWGYEDSDVANPTWSGSQASYGDPFTQWMDSNHLSNLAWMYHHDWTSALLKGDGRLTLYGTFVKQYLALP